MTGAATEIQGKLPIDGAGKYEVRFEPARGKTPAKVTRVALYDGMKPITKRHPHHHAFLPGQLLCDSRKEACRAPYSGALR